MRCASLSLVLCGWLLAAAALTPLSGCSKHSSQSEQAGDRATDAAADRSTLAESDQQLAPTAPTASSPPPPLQGKTSALAPQMSSPATLSAPQSANRSATAGRDSLPMAATANAPTAAAAPDAMSAAAPTTSLGSLPAGSSVDGEAGYATVRVYYATDRLSDPLPLSAYTLSGPRQLIGAISFVTLICLLIACYSWLQDNQRWAGLSLLFAGGGAALAVVCIGLSGSQIEKRGVQYSGERGELVHGISEVTVPLSHQRGQVERPSLLRFELAEDQSKHIVLTSATELNPDDFHRRLADSVADSPAADLLVFIHGYNVDFQSAVRRTAQIAVDLPFEGVPVCYSWPSQGKLLGYSVDETNAQWTEPHLFEFLQDLLNQSGAKSVHVVAHSMGNRPMTAVMQRFAWQQSTRTEPLFDRIVLAAPDVDADRFRRDLAPILTQVAHQTTLYASSSDQALILSKLIHGYPRAGESGEAVVVVPGIETIDVSGIDLSLLGHSYYGDNESMLRDLYDVVKQRLPAAQRQLLSMRQYGELIYWQLAQPGGLSPSGLTPGGNAMGTASQWLEPSFR